MVILFFLSMFGVSSPGIRGLATDLTASLTESTMRRLRVNVAVHQGGASGKHQKEGTPAALSKLEKYIQFKRGAPHGCAVKMGQCSDGFKISHCKNSRLTRLYVPLG